MRWLTFLVFRGEAPRPDVHLDRSQQELGRGESGIARVATNSSSFIPASMWQLHERASISVVAHRDSVTPHLLYRWRKLTLEEEAVAFSNEDKAPIAEPSGKLSSAVSFESSILTCLPLLRAAWQVCAQEDSEC